MTLRTRLRALVLASALLAAAQPARAAAPLARAAPPDSLALVLNVPACRLDATVDGVVRSYPVSPGTADHPTPLGTYRVDRVIWNPWWVPPPFPWAAGYDVTPPGPNNPIGRVKLYFGGYLFLHGTPAEDALGTPASHGCVRMAQADAMDLARAVHTWATPLVPDSLVDALMSDPGLTRSIALERPVTLSIEYRRVEVRDGRIEVHPDVYGLDPLTAREVVGTLVAAGVDPERLDPDRVEELLDRAREGPVAVPVGTLLNR